MIKNLQDIKNIIHGHNNNQIIDVCSKLDNEITKYNIDPEMKNILDKLDEHLTYSEINYCLLCKDFVIIKTCHTCDSNYCGYCECQNCNNNFQLECYICETAFSSKIISKMKNEQICFDCSQACCDQCIGYTHRDHNDPIVSRCSINTMWCKKCAEKELCKHCEKLEGRDVDYCNSCHNLTCRQHLTYGQFYRYYCPGCWKGG